MNVGTTKFDFPLEAYCLMIKFWSTFFLNASETILLKYSNATFTRSLGPCKLQRGCNWLKNDIKLYLTTNQASCTIIRITQGAMGMQMSSTEANLGSKSNFKKVSVGSYFAIAFSWCSHLISTARRVLCRISNTLALKYSNLLYGNFQCQTCSSF